MSEITTFPESVGYSKTPSFCVELIWSSGARVLALPTAFLVSADWKKTQDLEQIECLWGNWIITFRGHGLQRLPGALVRGEICAISELAGDHAEVTPGTVVTQIQAVVKKPEHGD